MLPLVELERYHYLGLSACSFEYLAARIFKMIVSYL